jgi:hypothetical protein
MHKNAIYLIGCCLLAAACEKDISVDLHQKADKLVVEGRIETGGYPEVMLTRSLDYFSHITPEKLRESFVHGATVTVSDGQRTMKLKEQSRDTTGGIKWYYYTVDPSQIAGAFRGKEKSEYKLRVTIGDREYSAATTIPAKGMAIDSIWWERKSGSSTLARVMVKVQDPEQRGNYSRYVTSRNRGVFMSGLNSTLDDQIVNGTSFEVMMEAGADRNQKVDFDTYGYFKRGDTVTVKFSAIDKATFDFWRTLDFAYASTGNPFSSPLQIQGNIPNALGYWGGYATSYKTIRIKK